MKRLLFVIAVAALTAPAALAAEPGAKSSSAHCKALQKSAPAMFGAGKTYKNLGACVSAKDAAAAVTASTAAKNSAKACKAERATNPAAFTEKYGTNKNGKNAFGKCVSGKSDDAAEERTAEEQQAELKATKTCKAALKMPEAAFKSANGGKTFAQKYGTNKNGKNAFGKCVSSTAKAG